MKLKKYVSSLLIVGACISSSMNLSFANEPNQLDLEKQGDEAIIQYQLDKFEEVNKEIRENRDEIIKPDKESNGAKGGTYPTRAGTILVTGDGKVENLIGHAGVVYNANTVIESFPSGGVGSYSNTWRTRYKTVYGLSSKNVSVQQDIMAATYANAQRGKKYNYIFTNTSTTNSFYCSQLVYRAFLDKAGVNMNYGGGIVFPIDLVSTPHTYTLYTQGV